MGDREDEEEPGARVAPSEGDVDDAASSSSSSSEEDAAAKRPQKVIVETKGKRGEAGILRAAEAADWADNMSDFSSVDPDEADYELKLRARQIVINGYPMYQRPTLRDLVQSITSQTESVWKLGAWVEYLGSDMVWRAAQVRRVVRQAPDSWDWTDPANDDREPPWSYFYNVGKQTLLPGKAIRATEEGLKVIFGSRPWVWQQHALLRLEKYTRFQKDHERDFDEVDMQKFAEDMYDDWLADARNVEFKTWHDKKQEAVQELLRNHLLTPFQLMDAITEDEEVWDFDQGFDVSVYTYLSVLGTGSTFALLCLGIQLVIPFVLMLNALVSSPRFDANFSFKDVHVRADWDDVCTGDGSGLGKILNLAVLMLYLLTVIPASFMSFYRAAGDAETTYSRINSLREVVWTQGDDQFLQMLGFKMDRYLNTAYVAFLYSLMLFILFNTTEVLDIVLNALAADFVHRIDEVIAGEEFFDPGRRWMQAGTVQLVMQSTLRLRVMHDPLDFCRFFDIDPARYAEAFGRKAGSPLPPLHSHAIADRDDDDPQYKTAEDTLFFLAAEYAEKKDNPQAFRMFKKRVASFSYIDRFLNRIRRHPNGVFHKYKDYRCWSTWDRVLFLARVPTRTEVRAARAAKVYVPNLEPAGVQFLKHVTVVLLGLQLVRDVLGAAKKGMYQRIPFHTFDGLLQMVAYAVQLSFPVLIVAGLFFIPICY